MPGEKESDPPQFRPSTIFDAGSRLPTLFRGSLFDKLAPDLPPRRFDGRRACRRCPAP